MIRYIFNKKSNILDILLENELIIDPELDELQILNLEEVEELVNNNNKLIKITDELKNHIIYERKPKGRFYQKKGNSFIGILAKEKEIYVREFDKMFKCAIWLFETGKKIDNYIYLLENSNLDYKFHEEIDTKRENHIWYGGPLLTISYKNYDFIVEAVGDVEFNLLTEDGSEIFSIVDNENQGILGEKLVKYIDNDYELNKILEKDLDYPKEYNIYCTSKNRWQCRIKNRKEVNYENIKKINLQYFTDVVYNLLEGLDRLVEKEERRYTILKEIVDTKEKIEELKNKWFRNYNWDNIDAEKLPIDLKDLYKITKTYEKLLKTQLKVVGL